MNAEMDGITEEVVLTTYNKIKNISLAAYT